MNLRDVSSRTWSKNYRDLVNWNEQQISILDEVRDSNNNITVVARAGCGKSSTLIGIVGALGVNTTTTGNILAFNSHIADHLKGDKRIPSSKVKVSTAHSYGLSMLRKFIDKPIINKNKYNFIIDGVIEEKGIRLEDIVPGDIAYKKSVARDIQVAIYKLAGLCRSWLVGIEDIEGLSYLYDYYGYTFPIKDEDVHLLSGIISKALSIGRDQALNEGIIDFGDMVWLPNELDLNIGQYKDVVMMDEAQDINLAMMGIIERLIGPSTRAIFMCDNRQEIYGFNGSVPGICNRISQKFNTKTMLLSYCYRCPELHLDMVRKWVPDILCGKEDPNGTITRTTHKEMLKEYKPGMVVIGRFNAPLIELGVRLITQGKPVYIPNKDLTQGFISLLESIGDMSIEQGIYVLEERKDRELNKINTSKGKVKRRIKNILDRFDGTLFLLNELGPSKHSIRGVIRFLEDLKDKPIEESVVIRTIHSFKGGEADDVVILDSDELPCQYLCNVEWEEDMEENIAYVAHTRSRKNLYMVNLKGK